jgi:hypothetical protein
VTKALQDYKELKEQKVTKALQDYKELKEQ